MALIYATIVPVEKPKDRARGASVLRRNVSSLPEGVTLCLGPTTLFVSSGGTWEVHERDHPGDNFRAERCLKRDKMPKPILPKNDGWTDVAYDFGLPTEDNARISHILNEACHVFHYHAGGTWASADKDRFATALAGEIGLRPGLVGRLLSTEDRVVKMLTYRALELSGKSTPQDDR